MVEHDESTRGRKRRDSRPGLRSPLTIFCSTLGVEPEVSPGLVPGDPRLDDEGDNRYALGDELGRGGGGTVHLAVDRHLRRAVALKTLPQEHVRDPVRVQAFLEEAIVTGGLEHPNIVPAYDMGWSDLHGPYYTMKRLAGESLGHVLDRLRTGEAQALRTFTVTRLLGYFVEICRAVAHAHARGVIHTDLKPSNVLIGEHHEVVVVDWGLAMVLGPEGARQARARLHAGTPEYISPEQLSGPVEGLDVRTDIWSLGVMLYELLTLTVPFRGQNPQETGMRVLIEPIEVPSERAPERTVAPGLEQICMKSLERNRDQRYTSVTGLLDDVESYLEGTRERMYLAELARHALARVKEQFALMQPREQRYDELAPELVGGSERDGVRPEVDGLREHLLSGYRRAGRALLRGLHEQSPNPELSERAGDLYWRIFTRVYPSTIHRTESVREASSELLRALHQRAPLAVARVGIQVARDLGYTIIEGTEDPWLAVVRAISGGVSTGELTPSRLGVLAERIAFLNRVPLFASLKSAGLLAVAEACREVHCTDGEAIFNQGDRGDALFVLTLGNVRVVRDGATINELHRGDCFGEIAIFAETTRTAGVVADGEVTCLALDASAFQELVRENAEIGLTVIAVLGERLRVATEREAALRSLATTLSE